MSATTQEPELRRREFPSPVNLEIMRAPTVVPTLAPTPAPLPTLQTTFRLLDASVRGLGPSVAELTIGRPPRAPRAGD